MTAKLWPSTLPPRNVMFDVAGQSESGGVSSAGFEQVIIGSAGRLIAQLEIFVGTQTQLLAARAMKAHMRGRANTILIGPYDRRNSPAGVAGENPGPFSVPHSDDAFFSDGAGYDQIVVPAHVGSAAALGDAEIIVVMEAGHAPQPGQWFGLKGKELYLIDTAEEESDGIWRMSFEPTLRRDATAGEAVEFDNPLCEMRATGDSVARLALDVVQMAAQNLELVEAVP